MLSQRKARRVPAVEKYSFHRRACPTSRFHAGSQPEADAREDQRLCDVCHRCERFIIPALGDSANDLLGKIGGKWLDKGQTEEGSDLVVVVTNRFFQGSGIVKSDYNPYSHTLTSGEMQLRIVTIRIVTRDNASTDAYGYDATSWRSAANGAKKVFEQFAEANYQKIVSLRGR